MVRSGPHGARRCGRRKARRRGAARRKDLCLDEGLRNASLPRYARFGRHRGRAGTRAKRPVSSTSVGVTILHPKAFDTTKGEQWIRDYHLSAIARVAINRRLAARRDAEPGLWTQSFFRDGRTALLSPQTALFALTTAENWGRALDALQEEMRRAALYDLTADEVAAVKKDVERQFVRAVRQKSAMTNADLAEAFVSNVNADLTYTSVEQDLADYRAQRDSITVEEVNALLKAAFAPENRRIQVSGNVDVSEADVLARWAEGEQKTVTPPAAAADIEFPYLKVPAEGKAPALTSAEVSKANPALTAHTVTLENGLTLHLLPVRMQKGSVSATLAYGNGIAGVRDDESTAVRTAYAVLAQNGVGRLSSSDTAKVLGARGIAVQEAVGTHVATISGSAPSDEVATLLEAIRTQWLDPVLTEANRVRAVSGLKLSSYRRDRTVDGVQRSRVYAFFTGDRAASLSLREDEADDWKLEDLQAVLRARRAAPLRALVVTGDFDPAVVAEEAARRFGTLDRVRHAMPVLGAPANFPEGKTLDLTVKGDEIGKAVVTMAFHRDLDDTNDRRTFVARRLAAAALGDLLREEIREKLAVAYSPFAVYRAIDIENGFGWLELKAETSLHDEKAVVETMRGIAERVQTEGIAPELVERVRKPMKTAWSTNRGQNRLWERLYTNEKTLDLPAVVHYDDMGRFLDAVTQEEVEAAARDLLSAPSALSIVRSESDKKAPNRKESSR